MADTKLTDLTAATDTTGAVVYGVQAGTDKQFAASLFGGGGSFDFQFAGAGEYILPTLFFGFSNGTIVPSDNLIQFYPCIGSLTVDAISVEVTTAATGNARMGIYSAGADGLPDELLASSAEIDTSTTGIKDGALGSDYALPSKFWLAAVSTGGATFRSFAYTTIFGATFVGQDNLGSSYFPIGYCDASFTYGALPADTSALTITRRQVNYGNRRAIGLRVA
ncbi:hypothetical protein ACLB6G_20290 [Zhengella sp. ZM62]|uniref:hypothetical protein n=1 Tax=Zhengella sedimenti TaxID=3390035 RepID=UPI003976760A